MREFVEVFNIVYDVFVDAFSNIGNFIKSNLRNIALILSIALPYIMYFIGQKMHEERNVITVGSEILIPIIFCILIYVIKSLANKLGKGTTIPLPNKRFTEVDDESGEVSIEHDRVHELLLYIADLEDWFERKGLL